MDRWRRRAPTVNTAMREDPLGRFEQLDGAPGKRTGIYVLKER